MNEQTTETTPRFDITSLAEEIVLAALEATDGATPMHPVVAREIAKNLLSGWILDRDEHLRMLRLASGVKAPSDADVDADLRASGSFFLDDKYPEYGNSSVREAYLIGYEEAVRRACG